MTKQQLVNAKDLQYREEQGRGALELAEREKDPWRKCVVLMGNASKFVQEITIVAFWDAMKDDAERELERLRKEFEAA